jgi:hypothetical protein
MPPGRRRIDRQQSRERGVLDELVVVDECQHVSAVTFESTVRHAATRGWLGLTATPYRRVVTKPMVAVGAAYGAMSIMCCLTLAENVGTSMPKTFSNVVCHGSVVRLLASQYVRRKSVRDVAIRNQVRRLAAAECPDRRRRLTPSRVPIGSPSQQSSDQPRDASGRVRDRGFRTRFSALRRS